MRTRKWMTKNSHVDVLPSRKGPKENKIKRRKKKETMNENYNENNN